MIRAVVACFAFGVALTVVGAIDTSPPLASAGGIFIGFATGVFLTARTTVEVIRRRGGFRG